MRRLESKRPRHQRVKARLAVTVEASKRRKMIIQMMITEIRSTKLTLLEERH
jgi:hypothetical protein